MVNVEKLFNSQLNILNCSILFFHRSSFRFNSFSRLISGLIDFTRRMRKVASARRLLDGMSKLLLAMLGSSLRSFRSIIVLRVLAWLVDEGLAGGAEVGGCLGTSALA